MTGRHTRRIVLAVFAIVVLCASVDAQQTLADLRARAEQGDADAQYQLGRHYESGEGVPQDYAEAVRWFRLAAEQGDADAQYNLAGSYRSGEGVPQDYAEAVRWNRLAAEQGFATAQLALGVMYAVGQGAQQDFVKAHMWSNLAVSQISGEPREKAVEIRDNIARLMTPAQITEAQGLATEWVAAHPREP